MNPFTGKNIPTSAPLLCSWKKFKIQQWKGAGELLELGVHVVAVTISGFVTVVWGGGMWWSDLFDHWRQITESTWLEVQEARVQIHVWSFVISTEPLHQGWRLLDNLQMPLAIMQFQYYKWFIFQACRTLQSTLSYWTKGRCFLSGSTRRNSVRSLTITKSSCWLVKQAVAKQHRYYIQW